MAEYVIKEALQAKLNRKKAGPANKRYTEGWNDAILMVKSMVHSEQPADVAPVRHGRCDVCSGKAVLTQDAYNGYSLEIDTEQQEAAVWYGDECLAVFHIDYCPNCGAKMDLEG